MIRSERSLAVLSPDQALVAGTIDLAAYGRTKLQQGAVLRRSVDRRHNAVVYRLGGNEGLSPVIVFESVPGQSRGENFFVASWNTDVSGLAVRWAIKRFNSLMDTIAVPVATDSVWETVTGPRWNTGFVMIPPQHKVFHFEDRVGLLTDPQEWGDIDRFRVGLEEFYEDTTERRQVSVEDFSTAVTLVTSDRNIRTPHNGIS